MRERSVLAVESEPDEYTVRIRSRPGARRVSSTARPAGPASRGTPTPRPPSDSPALVYLAELHVRSGDRDAAAAVLAQVEAIELSAADREILAADLASAAQQRDQ